MVEVRLHGALGREFGRLWRLDVSSPAEALRAIESLRPGIVARIQTLASRGLVFLVRTDGKLQGEQGLSLGGARRIDFAPVVQGASAGVRFVVGAVLVVAAANGAGPWAATMGYGLMVGSVVEWLTPVQDKKDNEKVGSWTISGAGANAEQGSPVPVIYGEVLVGGSPISAGVSVTQMAVPSDPAIVIEGDKTVTACTGGAYIGAYYPESVQSGQFTIGVNLTAAPANLGSASLTWGWSGFAGATSVSVQAYDSGTSPDGDGGTYAYAASCQIKVTVPLGLGDRLTPYMGTVSLTATGTVLSATSLHPKGEQATVSTTTNVTAILNTYSYQEQA